MRFVIDETSFNLSGRSQTDVEAVLDAFVSRVDAAEERGERVGALSALQEDAEIAAGVKLYQFLWEPAHTLGVDRDTRQRLSRCLDRALLWDEVEELEHLEVQIDHSGRPLLALSIALAHQSTLGRQAMACLPLRCADRQGPLPVSVAGRTVDVHFVTNEAEHLAFFRAAVTLENADEHGFQALAPSAFPSLRWADGVWGGLRDFSKPFRDIRDDLLHHLSVLNDHGANIFREGRGKTQTTPGAEAGSIGAHANAAMGQIEGRLGSLGVRASDENGKAKQNKVCKEARTRPFGGQSYVFWWHTKLEPDRDRVHFVWREGISPEEDQIIIGIFHRHLPLPGQ